MNSQMIQRQRTLLFSQRKTKKSRRLQKRGFTQRSTVRQGCKGQAKKLQSQSYRHPESASDPASVEPTMCAFDYLRDPVTGKGVGQEELIQLLVTFDLMRDCGIFASGSFSSHFTHLIYAWLCSQRTSCPSLGLLFSGGKGYKYVILGRCACAWPKKVSSTHVTVVCSPT